MIGTNKKDATETVELLLEDARGGLPRRRAARRDDLLAERGVEPCVYPRAGRRSTRPSERPASRTAALG